MHPTPGGARSTRTRAVIAAPPDRLYRAFLDPDELLAWLPPADMTGRFHRFDAREGGGYEMSLFYRADEPDAPGKTAAHEDRVAVRFVELVPPHRIVEAVRFVTDAAAFAGEMTLTVTLRPVGGGTEVTMHFDGLPPGLNPEDNDAGARLSLGQLAARFV